ncbi:hypothetical protein RhiJN_00835 [Ceratobasidium sp. AG-Ba]|nr:hypothetical protein RhiJN_00835 [Ceratobasidium sp. AG-Ba]QRW01865.1 hypothetical protein RhiLY_00862 [Ceratobasidium sp. AG-Ba]
MHTATTAILVAAAALQANANPLFLRQVSGSLTPVSTITANLTSSSYPATGTFTGSVPLPTGFPLPGSNGTYYLCAFPQANDTTPTSSGFLSTSTLPSISLPSASQSAPTVTTDVFAVNATPSGSATPTITSLTSSPVVTPAPTVTPFTVVGPNATMTIECIQVPAGPPPPGPGPVTDSLPPLPTLSGPPPTPTRPVSSVSATTLTA